MSGPKIQLLSEPNAPTPGRPPVVLSKLDDLRAIKELADWC